MQQLTPKEEAIQLVNNFGKIIGKPLKNGGYKYNIETAKQCAICCINKIKPRLNLLSTNGVNSHSYWEIVIQEISKL